MLQTSIMDLPSQRKRKITHLHRMPGLGQIYHKHKVLPLSVPHFLAVPYCEGVFLPCLLSPDITGPQLLVDFSLDGILLVKGYGQILNIICS